MKISQSRWKENNDDRKNSRAESRRQNVENETNAAAKSKQPESSWKDELKFAGILKSATNPQKLKQTEDDPSEQRRDDDKKEKKRADGQKDSSDNLTNGDRIEKYDQSNGGQFGGSGGFGAGGNINQTINLSENFAARSILHIADLERMISAVRNQTALGGKREILLELKRSVLEGLKVKITTDVATQVQIEFLAASEKVRSQVENHAEELSSILRGRGINLKSLRTSVETKSSDGAASSADASKSHSSVLETTRQNASEETIDENTFGTEKKTILYRA